MTTTTNASATSTTAAGVRDGRGRRASRQTPWDYGSWPASSTTTTTTTDGGSGATHPPAGEERGRGARDQSIHSAIIQHQQEHLRFGVGHGRYCAPISCPCRKEPLVRQQDRTGLAVPRLGPIRMCIQHWELRRTALRSRKASAASEARSIIARRTALLSSHHLPVPSRARRPKRPAVRSKNAKMLRSGCVEETARSETARTADARAWQRSPGSVLVLAPDPSGAGLVSGRFGGATGTHGGVILTVP
jgi:hypothetical protein